MAQSSANIAIHIIFHTGEHKSQMYIDSHAHLTGDAVFPQVEALLSRAQDAGIKAIVNICTDAITLQRGIALANQFPWIHNAAAVTPHDIDSIGERDFAFIADCARSGLLKSVGETGLDYHYEHSDRKTQRDWLIRYLHLALECKLPVIIHCREAFSDFFTILDSEYIVEGLHAPGVLHCFTGTSKEAEEVIRRGWMLSLSGIVTFKKSLELQEVAKMVPLPQLLLETDTPYLAPQSKRGKPNEPANLVETAACIAKLRGITPEEVANATASNAEHLFLLNKETFPANKKTG